MALSSLSFFFFFFSLPFVRDKAIDTMWFSCLHGVGVMKLGDVHPGGYRFFFLVI